MDTEPTSTPRIADLEPVPAPRRAHPGRWAVGAVVILAAAVATVALAGTEPAAKTATVVLSQAASRTSSGTARVAMTAEVSASGHVIPIGQMSGASNFTTKDAALSLKIGPLTENLRVVGGVTYMSVTGVTLPRGAHWVKITPADLKINPAVVKNLNSGNPTSGLNYLSAVNGDPRVVDQGNVDGVAVTHYAFTLNLEAFFDQVGKATSAIGSDSLGSSIQALRAYVDLTKIPGEAWIDADGRVRRFEFSIEITDAGETGKMTADLHFSHFGEPVVVKAPAASDTIPFAEDPGFFTQIGDAARSAAKSG